MLQPTQQDSGDDWLLLIVILYKTAETDDDVDWSTLFARVVGKAPSYLIGAGHARCIQSCTSPGPRPTQLPLHFRTIMISFST